MRANMAQTYLSVCIRGDSGKAASHELLELVEESEFVYILETNGMTLGDDANLRNRSLNTKTCMCVCLLKAVILRSFIADWSAASAYELPFKASTASD